MAEKPKRPRDANQLAKFIVDAATKPAAPDDEQPGTFGRAVGGKARAQSLTSKRRSEIARDAAKARWQAKAKAVSEE